MSKVIYGGSFDPLTYGHEDLIRRAAKQFNHVTIGTGVKAEKEGKYLFSLQERLYLAREALKSILNIDVVAYRGLTTDYISENCYDLHIRGLRTAKDFEEEQVLDRALKRQDETFDTAYFNARQTLQDLSSSAVKSVLKEQGDIRPYVRLLVKQAMEGRLLGQYITGITGSVGSGKSFTTEQFLKLCEKNKIPAHHLDLDKIGHEILGTTLQEPIYQETRQKIIHMFGDEVANEDGSIHRKKLGPKVFSDPQKMENLNMIMRDPMKLRTKRLMYNQKGLFLYNAALIAEAGTSSILNNNVVLLNVTPEVQAERLKMRGLDGDAIQMRLSSQFTTEQKRTLLSQDIAQQQHGNIIDLQSPHNDQEIEIAFNAMLAQVDVFGELRFAGLFNRLGVKEDASSLFVELRNIYDRPIALDAKRDDIATKMKGNYHKRLHVVDCLNEFYKIKHLVKNPDVIECAILFHDIIYDPLSSTNEEDSADFAEQMLLKWGMPKDFIAEVKRYILLTKHSTVPDDMDGKFLVDIDVSILGKELKKYLQYSKDIRREYSAYSDVKYNQGRKDVLNFFKNKKHIYHTEYFQSLYADTAKNNIEYELSLLGQQ